jgi:hypothetical protein
MKPALAGLFLSGLLLSAPALAAVSYDAVAPILAERCVMCHSGPAAAAGLHLDTLQGVLAGSTRRARWSNRVTRRPAS